MEGESKSESIIVWLLTIEITQRASVRVNIGTIITGGK